MPQNKTQKFLYALMTVIITVNCFVFYNVYFVEKMSYPEYGAKMILIFIAVEFVFALMCELFVGSPLSEKLALRVVNPAKNPSFLVETAIISCTVAIMCPLMSFIAVFIYDGAVAATFDPSFTVGRFLANFIPNFASKVFHNFPFALFSQLFYIQPLMRKIFSALFSNKKATKAAQNANAR